MCCFRLAFTLLRNEPHQSNSFSSNYNMSSTTIQVVRRCGFYSCHAVLISKYTLIYLYCDPILQGKFPDLVYPPRVHSRKWSFWRGKNCVLGLAYVHKLNQYTTDQESSPFQQISALILMIPRDDAPSRGDKKLDQNILSIQRSGCPTQDIRLKLTSRV